MKTNFLRLLLPVLTLGLLSCQDKSSTASIEPSSIQVSARLYMANGESIPQADSVHFYVKIGTRIIDTAVPWALHGIDLGAVNAGEKIRWQASAYTWNAARTVRTIVWASQSKDTVAQSDNNTTAFTLQTPVLPNSAAAPVPTPSGFVADSAGKVVLPASADSSFTFSITVPAGSSKVTINDSLVKAASGSTYTYRLVVQFGATVPVKVYVQDTLGGATVTTYSVTRAKAGAAVDSASTVTFDAPTVGQVLPYGTDSVIVKVTTHSANKVDSVVLSGHRMTNLHDTVWQDTARKLTVGDSTLKATAYVFGKAGTPALVKVTRSIDSTVAISFLLPVKDTVVRTGMLSVSVNVVSGLLIDSVVVNIKGANGNSGTTKLTGVGKNWTGSISDYTGIDSVYATAYAFGKATVSSPRSITVVNPPLPSHSPIGGSYPDSVAVKITATGTYDSIQYTIDGINWKSTKNIASETMKLNFVLKSRSWLQGVASDLDTATYLIAHDSTLQYLAISGYTLSGAFSPSILTYQNSVNVPYSTSSVLFGATAASSLSTITFNGNASESVTLNGTLTPVKVKVVNGSSSLTYTVNIIRDRVPPPTITVTGDSVNEYRVVRLASSDLDFPLYYTLDSLSTTPNWIAISSSDSLILYSTATVKAVMIAANDTSLSTTSRVVLNDFGVAWKTGLTAFTGRFQDSRDGHWYTTIKMNTQTWMAQNLNYAGDSSTVMGGCISTGACDKYGRYYTQVEAMTVCPTGWHLPTSTEFQTVASYVGNSGWGLKASSGWLGTSVASGFNGTDVYGFRGLAAGCNGGGWCAEHYDTGWWTATGSVPAVFGQDSNALDVTSTYAPGYGFYVRCVK